MHVYVLLLYLRVQLAVEERDEKYMRLLAKHTLQTGISNKTAAMNEELKKANEQLAKVWHVRVSSSKNLLLHPRHFSWL